MALPEQERAQTFLRDYVEENFYEMLKIAASLRRGGFPDKATATQFATALAERAGAHVSIRDCVEMLFDGV